MEDITAFAKFVEYFANHSNPTSCYSFKITDLHTKLLELAADSNKLLIFYLHHSCDEFSTNFCAFLQDAAIEDAFHSDKFILYCWDIENDDLKPKLIESLRNEIGDVGKHYIEQNKSVVFIVKLENKVPFILDVYNDTTDLLRLQGLLTGQSSNENIIEDIITPLSFQNLMRNYLGERDYDSFEKKEHELLKNKIGFALYGPPTKEDGKMYSKDQQEEIDKLFLQILKENNAFSKWNGRIVISFIYVCAETLPEEKAKRILKGVEELRKEIKRNIQEQKDDYKKWKILVEKREHELKRKEKSKIQQKQYVWPFKTVDTDALRDTKECGSVEIDIEKRESIIREKVIKWEKYIEFLWNKLRGLENALDKNDHKKFVEVFDELRKKTNQELQKITEEFRKFQTDIKETEKELRRKEENWLEDESYLENKSDKLQVLEETVEKADHEVVFSSDECVEERRYNPDGDFVPYPVFILRKCKHKSNPTVACRIIIDHECRVYKSWMDYLTENRLSPCKMIYPKDGHYRSDGNVIFETKLSPACDLSKKVADISDVTVGVTGLVAGGVSVVASTSAILAAAPLVAAAAPVALPVAAALGIGSGIYTAARSIYSLVDRGKHKQAIGLSSSESRAAYLNLAGGVLSASMFGAARTMTFLAEHGVQLGQGTQYVLHGINGANLTVNGIGIGNKIYEAHQARKASPLIMAQISASIFFYGNSLYNFKAVASIIEESQTMALSEIENSLRNNRHRLIFNKLIKETIDTELQSRKLIISPIRNMENLDDVASTLLGYNKMLSNQGIHFSAHNGQIYLNNIAVELVNFGSRNKVKQIPFTESFSPIPENLTSNEQCIITQEVQSWLNGIRILHGYVNDLIIAQLVKEIFSAFEPFVRIYIMDISAQFFNHLDSGIVNRLLHLVNGQIIKLIIWVVNELKNNKVSNKIFNHKDISGLEFDSIVNDLVIELLYQYVNYEFDMAKIEERKEERRIGNAVKIQETCKSCSGYYYVQ